MALTLEQYDRYLDTQNLLWPKAPVPEPPDLTPRLGRVRGLRAVTFEVYGTLVAVAGGSFTYHLPDGWQAEVALDRTVQEFKMWPAMTRKALKPAQQLGEMYRQVLERTQLERSTRSRSGHPEVKVEAFWQTIVQQLMRNGYRYDANFYGPPAEYGQKIAYFFHRCLQGIGPYEGALATLRRLQERGVVLGIIANGQCFTRLQLLKALRTQGPIDSLEDLFAAQVYSCEVRARKPASRVFQVVLEAFGRQGLQPRQVLHVGSDPYADVFGARQMGMPTALFVGDKAAQQRLESAAGQPNQRPDLILTRLDQLMDVLTGPP